MEWNNCYKCSVMSDCKQVPCPRTLSLRDVLDFFAKPKCEPATSHTCSKGGVVEAIPLQAALVFGLLRYARNDKKQDGRVVLKDFSP